MSRANIPHLGLALYKQLTKSFKGYAASFKNDDPHHDIARLLCENILPLPSQILSANETLCDVEYPEIPNDHIHSAGKVLKFKTDTKSELIEADEDNIRDAQIIISPGLGGAANGKRSLSTFGDFATELFPDKKCLLYSPLDEVLKRDDRYAKGMRYYVEQHSINEKESENFYNTVIKPRLFDEHSKMLPPSEFQKIMLASFSIGCREAESHFRYFERQLKLSGLTSEQREEYTNKFIMLHIASPRNWSPNIEQVDTLSLISLSDIGSKKLPQFLLDFYLSPELHSQIISKILRPNQKELLITLADGVVPCGSIKDGKFTENPLGHNLHEHVVGINNNETARESVDLFASYLDPKMSHKDFQAIRTKEFAGAAPYKESPDCAPSQEGLEALFGAIKNYHDRERIAKAEALATIPSASVVMSPSACGMAIKENDATFPPSTPAELGSISRKSQGR